MRVKVIVSNSFDFVEKELLLDPRLLSGRNVEDYISKIKDNAEIVSITIKGVVIGCAVYYCNNLESKIAYISMLIVNKEYQGKGIGGWLLDSVIMKVQALGFNICRLEVRNDNNEAIHLYSKKGFIKINKDDEKMVMSRAL